MSIRSYLKDKMVSIIISIIFFTIVISLLIFFEVNKMLIIFMLIMFVCFIVSMLLYNYLRKKSYYNDIRKKLNDLDKKYFISELIKGGEFLEAKIVNEYLYEINKCYIDSLNQYKQTNIDFREYIELWCHEIKTPIATTKLLLDNNKTKINKELINSINKIEYYVEQVLYYERSEMVEKDYIIKKTNLKDLINKVIKNNKQDLINKQIKINTLQNNIYVNTDSKWLEFIINQIIINSIKYISKNPIIEISVEENINNKILYIKDNGIGIKEEELEKVFEKGYVGTNGREKYNSTGMGLYLVKKLCNKLGHEINIKSDKFTIVTIIFPNNSLVDIK